MADGFNLEQFATGLQGFGAGVAGQLPQFQQGLASQQQRKTEQANSARKTFINGVGAAHSLLGQGQIQNAIQVLAEINDPNAQQLAQELSNPDMLQEAMGDINSFVSRARAKGDLTAPDAPKQQIVGGQVVTLGDTPTATDIEGFSPQAERGRDTLAQVQSSDILPDGSTVQVFKDGSTRVTGPQGRVLKGQERQTAIEDAQEFGIDVQSRRAGGRTGATGEENRANALITRGATAAESTATIRRAIGLMDVITTGGPQAVSLAIKQRLGIEGADEGELSNSLGKSVLSQLRETFGAAFTENEGNRLSRIEAGFGKSTETNKRLLGQALRIAERTANRAIKAAKKRGNMAEVADIEDLLSFSLELPEAQPAQQQQTGQPAAGGVTFLGFE